MTLLPQAKHHLGRTEGTIQPRRAHLHQSGRSGEALLIILLCAGLLKHDTWPRLRSRPGVMRQEVLPGRAIMPDAQRLPSV